MLSKSQDDPHGHVSMEKGRPRVQAVFCFFKEDCTIDEIVFSFVPLNPLATISRCAVLVAVLAQHLRKASAQFQL